MANLWTLTAETGPVNLLLNLLWFVLGGWIVLLAYLLGAVLLCLTIIGIPFGVQCLKLSVLGAAPFGRQIRERDPPAGVIALIMNIIWILLPGLELVILHLVLAAVFAITIIGLPFAAQHMKLARLALIPFGFRVVSVD
jgi:uncharacterized membrane protein YccF (DUF307 family)